MKQRCRELIEIGDKLFADRQPLHSLWQSLAENFHPMRADFTVSRYLSDELASYLMSARPALAHRDLSNALSFMLRPRGQQWFHARTGSEKVNKNSSAKAWLDWASETQHRAMYDRRAMFLRATKEGDKDFVAFGNTVITLEPNKLRDGLLYRCWHLRDVVWEESGEGAIDRVHFNWNPMAYQLCDLFPKTTSSKVKEAKDKDRLRTIKCRRFIVPSSDYDYKTNMPFTSIYVDCENETILEETGLRRLPVIPPRWETQPGSQYAYSPAAILGLPDARMLQQITLTMLEASQKGTDPAMIQVGEVINGGVNIGAGMLTNIDADYDERTGEALRPIPMQLEGIRYGAAREERIEMALADAFYLNKIQMPAITKEMTAYEAQRLYEEFIRQSLPLFEPMEVEYNGAVCELTFHTLRDMGVFGSILDMPQMLRTEDVKFMFDTPLQQAASRAKVQQFYQSLQMTAAAAQIDPDIAAHLDLDTAYRDAQDGGEAPATWLRPEDEAKAIIANRRQARQFEQAAAQVASGADVATRVAGAAESAGTAATALQEAGVA